MIVPASGHQVRCIPWVQMGTFNKEIGFSCGLNSLHWIYFVGNTYNRVYIWCCRYGENRYCERCANKYWCASKHTGLLNSCLGKWYLLPYLVVPLISARIPLISTRVSTHCQAILFKLNSGFFNSMQFQFKSDSESFNSIPIQFIFFQFQFNSIQILCTIINQSIK